MGVSMISNVRFWVAGVGVAGGSALAALMIGAGVAPAAHADTDDPAVFDYSADPSNVFSPVYTITPTGPEDVSVTDGSGDVFGTQDFTISELGFPVDTFTGSVEYTPLTGTGLSFISGELGGYSETITTLGSPGTLLPESTGFLIDEFGLGYGNVFEESMNSAGTSATVGDFILTPFGDENITPIVDLFLPQGVGITDAAAAVDPSSFADLLSSIGL
jgi:hypothetical protein